MGKATSVGKWKKKSQESEGTDRCENYSLGTIISAPVPTAETFCRSCLNSSEERTAKGDGC